jgi:lipid-binding SYLF domain-containing protein
LPLGADVSVAAGPVGREAAAATDAQLRAEIYSYSRSRGLFAGASFEGDALLIDRRGNDCFYGRGGVSPADIVANNGILIPPVALKLRAVLTAQSNPPVAVPPGPPPVVIEQPLPPMPPPVIIDPRRP